MKTDWTYLRSYTYVKDSLQYYKGILKKNKDIIYLDGSSLLATAKKKVKELSEELEDIKRREGRI